MSIRSFFKNKIKQIGNSALTGKILGRVLYAYCFLIYKTNRFEFIGWPEEKRKKGEGFFVSFWHGHLMAPTFIGFHYKNPQNEKIKWYLLASLHRDGRIVAETARCFGGGVIDGSSKKGGVGAGLTINRLMEASSIIFMSPDGRKPGYKMTKGIIRLASQTEQPVFLCAFATSKGKRFNTWDKFFFPFPFGKGVLMISEPVIIPPDLSSKDIEQWKEKLEVMLSDLTAKAEKYVGRQVPDFLMRKEEKP